MFDRSTRGQSQRTDNGRALWRGVLVPGTPFLTLGLLVLSLLACSAPTVEPTRTIQLATQTAKPTAHVVPPTATVIQATAEPTRVSVTPVAVEPFAVTFRRSGGFAGVNEEFVIRSDGSMEAAAGVRQLSPQAVSNLRAQIEATGLDGVPPGEYLPADPCCDRFTYELKIVKNGTTYDYITVDDTPGAPPELMDAIDVLQTFLESLAITR
jgi:hypothetical protein